MRLITEDAGGLVDCAHCGLELIAPDPSVGRGARLSRASEGRVGSINNFNLRNLRGDQLKHSRTPGGPEGEESLFEIAEEGGGGEDDTDPNHARVRGSAGAPAGRKSSIKALDGGKVGRSFRRQDVLAERLSAASDIDWDPAASRSGFGESRQDKRGFWVAAGLAAAVMLVVTALVMREANRSGHGFDETELDTITLAQKEQRQRFETSFGAAKRALASPSWMGLLPGVRNPQQVGPLMRDYYAANSYKPITLVGFHAPVEVEIGGIPMHEFRVTDTSGEVRTLVIETGDGAPKLDWELYVDLPRYDWEQFLESRPAAPQPVRVVASRASVLDRYFEDAGLTREQAVGFRLWQGDAAAYYAIVPKTSGLAGQMSELLEWEAGRKLIVQACFPPGSKLNDRIQLDGVIQTGWVSKKVPGAPTTSTVQTP